MTPGDLEIVTTGCSCDTKTGKGSGWKWWGVLLLRFVVWAVVSFALVYGVVHYQPHDEKGRGGEPCSVR